MATRKCSKINKTKMIVNSSSSEEGKRVTRKKSKSNARIELVPVHALCTCTYLMIGRPVVLECWEMPVWNAGGVAGFVMQPGKKERMVEEWHFGEQRRMNKNRLGFEIVRHRSCKRNVKLKREVEGLMGGRLWCHGETVAAGAASVAADENVQ